MTEVENAVPESWINRLFHRLENIYPQTENLENIDIPREIMQKWQTKLFGISSENIRIGLQKVKSVYSKLPSLDEFVALCKIATQIEVANSVPDLENEIDKRTGEVLHYPPLPHTPPPEIISHEEFGAKDRTLKPILEPKSEIMERYDQHRARTYQESQSFLLKQNRSLYQDQKCNVPVCQNLGSFSGVRSAEWYCKEHFMGS